MQLLEEHAPPSVLVNQAHQIVHLSPRAGKYLSLAPGEISTSLLALLPPELRSEMRCALSRAAQSSETVEVRQCVFEIQGQSRSIDIRVRPMRETREMRDPSLTTNAAPRFFLVIFGEGSAQVLAAQSEGAAQGEELSRLKRQLSEITEQREARREAEEKLSIAVEAGELGTWDWNLRRNEVQWNERHFVLFGIKPRPGPISPDAFRDSLHPEDAGRVMQALEVAVESGGVFQSQYRIVRESDGCVRWMSGYGRTVEWEDGRAARMLGVVFDSTVRHQADEVLRRSHEELEQIVRERAGELARVNEALELEVSERKRAEAGREMLLRRLVSAQEEERRRISRELHDQMGQTLTALMMGLKSLPDIPDTGLSPPTPNDIVAKLQHITIELMNDVHHLAWDLRPAVLDNLGLEAALGQYVAEWSRRSGTRADFLSHGMSGERLPEYVESALYRTAQEALTNVARHSHASHVSVLLELVEGEVVAIVEDDGAGFDTEATGESSSGRLGLAGMRERVEIAGGTLTIESSPGAGTTVYARVPVEK